MKLTAHQLARMLLAHRDNDLKMEVNNCMVPVGNSLYFHPGDFIVIEPDYNSEDYRIATAHGEPEQ